VTGWSERCRRIHAVVRAIPPGRVASYGEVAALANLPRGARQVGRALREAPADVALPWHRVLRADGRLAFPAAHPARVEQTQRLRAEGIPCLGGRVDLRRYRWQPVLDELLWGPLAEVGRDPSTP
jgi:methylated-DNA-protein-cysteine methyltransferase related protein